MLVMVIWEISAEQWSFCIFQIVVATGGGKQRLYIAGCLYKLPNRESQHEVRVRGCHPRKHFGKRRCDLAYFGYNQWLQI